jgi:hypothetical protein
MNNFIKQVIEEKFASKAQQRYFYAQAGKGGKKGKKWAKWAKEFSDKTDYEKIPDKVEKEEEVDEIVDKNGNIATSSFPTDFNTKGVTDDWTTDMVVKTAAGSMGTHGVHGTHTSLRYWAESDMSKTLGADETIMQDADYDEAYRHFTKDLGLSDEEAKERMGALGYEEKLPDDMVRLVENPLNFMEEYIDNLLKKKKAKDNDIVTKETEEAKVIHPIIKRQLFSLKNTMKNHGLSLDDIKSELENEDE